MLKNLTINELDALEPLTLHVQDQIIRLQGTHSDDYKKMREYSERLASHIGIVCPTCQNGHLLVPHFYALSCSNPECLDVFEEIMDKIPYPSMRMEAIVSQYTALRSSEFAHFLEKDHEGKLKYLNKRFIFRMCSKPVPTHEDIHMDQETFWDAMPERPVIRVLTFVHYNPNNQTIAFKNYLGKYEFGIQAGRMLAAYIELDGQNQIDLINAQEGLFALELNPYVV